MVGEKDFIVVLAPQDDVHAQAVVREARLLGATNSQIVDFQDLSTSMELDWTLDSGVFLRRNGTQTPIEEARSVWWRRVSAPHIFSVKDNETRRYCEHEYRELCQQVCACLEEKGLVLNSQRSRYLGSSKIMQLKAAISSGLCVPPTCITNSPETARRFVEMSKNPVVAKGFGGTRERFSPTQLVDNDSLEHLPGVSLSPVIFQERIPRSIDYRVTVVGDEIFSAEVRTDFGGADIDWRNDSGAECCKCRLPGEIEVKIMKVVREFGLFYCTIDLMKSETTNQINFLEINECGQYLFVEMDTGMPISRKIAEKLLGKN